MNDQNELFGGRLADFIRDNAGELYRIHRELCLIPAPSGFEDERARYCKNYLTSAGAEGVYIDDAKNVVFPLNCEGSDKITVFSAHTDTVFPAGTALNYTDDGEWLRCPGVGDDTANLAVLLLSVKFLLSEHYVPENGILFAANSCEEGLGNLKGVRQLFRDYAGRIARMIPLDANLYRISDRCVGSHRYEVTVSTPGGHSFHAFGVPNAIAEAAKLVSAIYSLSVPVRGDSRTTYNVGVISGGTSVNSVAQEASFLCEYRSDSVECLALMKEKFRKIFEADYGEQVRVTVKTIGERPCADGVDENEIARMTALCRELYAAETGQTPALYSSSTDCNIPLSLGIPAICIGAVVGKGAHTLEESAEKASMLTGLRIIPQAIVKLAALN